MTTYPKFLKNTPKTLGLGPQELFLIVSIITMGLILQASNLQVIGLILVSIALNKMIRHYIDLKTIFVPKVKQSIFSDLGKKDYYDRAI